MRLNHKQEELIAELAGEIEEKFPDVRFVEVVPSPEGENTLLLHFTQPATDDRFMEIAEYSSARTMDILLNYGYHLIVLPVVENGMHFDKSKQGMGVISSKALVRLNLKQKDLIEQLANEIEEKFPEVKFVEVELDPESDNTLWLKFTQPDDEDRLIELGEYASERTTDILLDYGYHFVVLPVVENGKPAAQAMSAA